MRIRKKKKSKKMPRKPAPEAEFQPGNILLTKRINSHHLAYPVYGGYTVFLFLEVWKIKAIHYRVLVLQQGWIRSWHFSFHTMSEGQFKKNFLSGQEVAERDLEFLVLFGDPQSFVQSYLKESVEIKLNKDLLGNKKALAETEARIQNIKDVKQMLSYNKDNSDDRNNSE